MDSWTDYTLWHTLYTYGGHIKLLALTPPDYVLGPAAFPARLQVQEVHIETFFRFPFPGFPRVMCVPAQDAPPPLLMQTDRPKAFF